VNCRVANADRVRLSSKTNIANVDVIIACREREPSLISYNNVATSGGVAKKRERSGGSVGATSAIV
jgi:hypothetical protein